MRTIRLALLVGLLAWLAAPGPASAEPTTVFVQADAQHLVAGDADDAPGGVSWTLSWFGIDEVTIPALDVENRDELVAATLQIVEQQWAEVDVHFVTARPSTGPYLMVTLGGTADVLGLGGAGGWGIIDCYDQNKTGVAFAFGEVFADDQGRISPERLAMVVSQELAHTVGLEHLGGSEEFIMYPSTNDAPSHRFSDECEAIEDPVTSPTHPEYCLDHPGCPTGYQDDLAHLVAYLGPASGDGSSTSGDSDDGTGSSGSADSSDSDTDTDPGSTTGAGTSGTTDGETSGTSSSEASSGPTDDPTGTDASGETSAGAEGSAAGCGCATTASAPPWLLVPPPPRLRRRRPG